VRRRSAIDAPSTFPRLSRERSALIADRAFEFNAVIGDLGARGAKVVISLHPRHTVKRSINQEMYKWRHLVQNCFGNLIDFKRVALYADKADQSRPATISLMAAVMSLRSIATGLMASFLNDSGIPIVCGSRATGVPVSHNILNAIAGSVR
jgi:hypothetical protein